MASVLNVLYRAFKTVIDKCKEVKSYLISVDAVEMADIAWDVLGSSSESVKLYPGSLQLSYSVSMPNFHFNNNVSQKKKWTRDDFDFLKVLGRGAYGKVFLAREKLTSRLYAVKVLNKKEIIKNKEVDHTLVENRVLRITSNNPFLISLMCSFKTQSCLFNVMEYACGGDLFYYRSKYGQFLEDTARFYGAEITLALEYLHQHGILYRDLKLENVLVMKDGHVKLADFGLCKDRFFHGSITNTFCGTAQYLAPEIILNEGHGLAVDWWNFGVVMYTLLCEDYPFWHDDESQLYSIVLEEDPKIPEDLSQRSADFLTGLLTKDPEARLGGGRDDSEDVMKHPFFSSVNWVAVYEKGVEPPYKPKIGSDADTSYFDTGFTRMAVNVTTEDDYEGDEFFKDFSYQNDDF